MYYYRLRRRTSTTHPRHSMRRDDLRQAPAHTAPVTEAPERYVPPGGTPATATAEPQAQGPASMLDTQTLLLLLPLLESLAQAAGARAGAPAPPSESADLMVDSEPPAAEGEEEYAQDMQPAPLPRASRTNRLAVVLLLLCVLICLAAIAASLLPLVTASATVTIIPVQQAITASTALSVVTTGTANPAREQVPGRRLSALTLSQQEIVLTTGVGHQLARSAQGSITFYNAAPSVQTIGAGTLLTGSDGVQVVTEQDAVIPAVAYPTLGQVTVAAHAVIAGPGGNIHAGDIYGPCCRLNVSAVSSAFWGGQNARSYPMVTTQDMSAAVSTLTTSLLQSVEAAFGAQLHEGETLITPVPCTPAANADHAIGGEASHLTVTVDASCTGESYRTQAMHDLLKQIVSDEAMKHLGASYSLAGDIQATISHVSRAAQGTVQLAVTGSGTWGYQFSQEQLEHLKTLLVGKSEPEARAIVLQESGVQSVSISLRNASAMPKDISLIHMVLVAML